MTHSTLNGKKTKGDGLSVEAKDCGKRRTFFSYCNHHQEPSSHFPSLFIVNEQPCEDARRQHNKAVREMNLEAM